MLRWISRYTWFNINLRLFSWELFHCFWLKKGSADESDNRKFRTWYGKYATSCSKGKITIIKKLVKNIFKKWFYTFYFVLCNMVLYCRWPCSWKALQNGCVDHVAHHLDLAGNLFLLRTSVKHWPTIRDNLSHSINPRLVVLL